MEYNINHKYFTMAWNLLEFILSPMNLLCNRAIIPSAYTL